MDYDNKHLMTSTNLYDQAYFLIKNAEENYWKFSTLMSKMLRSKNVMFKTKLNSNLLHIVQQFKENVNILGED